MAVARLSRRAGFFHRFEVDPPGDRLHKKLRLTALRQHLPGRLLLQGDDLPRSGRRPGAELRRLMDRRLRRGVIIVKEHRPHDGSRSAVLGNPQRRALAGLVCVDGGADHHRGNRDRQDRRRNPHGCLLDWLKKDPVLENPVLCPPWLLNLIDSPS